MSWLRDRLTGKRLVAVGLIIAVTAALMLVGDPLRHPEEGEQTTGEWGVSGVPRLVFFAGLAIALILGLPPRTADEDGPKDP